VNKPKTTTLKLVLAYDGTNFKGWQRGNGRTVQSTLEEALKQSLGSASPGGSRTPADVKVDGAGRTDAGVHAEGQVASLVLPHAVDPNLLLDAVNHELPSDLSVRSVEVADERFHARYRATAKTYRYRVVDGPVGDPFLRRFSWRVRDTLDVGRMEAASAAFAGTHDFSAFTSDKSKKEKTRTIFSIDFERPEFSWGSSLDISFRGNGFLWRQVRVMAAALILAGTGETNASLLEAMLDSRDRAPAPAPARGLTLVSVEYDEE
jgi:tRNA pseudouridine38-40 synthase